MNKAFLFILSVMLVVATTATILSEEQYQLIFTGFVHQYEKVYETKDFLTRFNTFTNNLNYIIHTNSQNLGFELGVNQFADLSGEEFAQQYLNGLNITEQDVQQHADGVFESSSLDIPTSFDWRSRGIVAPVRNQGSCGSCYSFAAIASLETAHAKKTGKMVHLSEQQVVDCCSTTSGCNGGLPSLVFNFAKSGICSRSSYAYTGKKGSCKKCNPVVKASSFQTIAGNDNAHKQALADRGVTSIALDASSSNFQFYKSGILTNCPISRVNHAVNLVGYGSNYFILRNSWGTTWGENGYMRVKGGACGVARSSLDVVPTV